MFCFVFEDPNPFDIIWIRVCTGKILSTQHIICHDAARIAKVCLTYMIVHFYKHLPFNLAFFH